MIYEVNKNKYITRIAHEKEFNIWKLKLTINDYNASINELNNRIDSNEIYTLGWIPGSN